MLLENRIHVMIIGTTITLLSQTGCVHTCVLSSVTISTNTGSMFAVVAMSAKARTSSVSSAEIWRHFGPDAGSPTALGPAHPVALRKINCLRRICAASASGFSGFGGTFQARYGGGGVRSQTPQRSRS